MGRLVFGRFVHGGQCQMALFLSVVVALALLEDFGQRQTRVHGGFQTQAGFQIALRLAP